MKLLNRLELCFVKPQNLNLQVGAALAAVPQKIDKQTTEYNLKTKNRPRRTPRETRQEVLLPHLSLQTFKSRQGTTERLYRMSANTPNYPLIGPLILNPKKPSSKPLHVPKSKSQSTQSLEPHLQINF